MTKKKTWKYLLDTALEAAETRREHFENKSNKGFEIIELSVDFESGASTNSTTPASVLVVRQKLL